MHHFLPLMFSHVPPPSQHVSRTIWPKIDCPKIMYLLFLAQQLLQAGLEHRQDHSALTSASKMEQLIISSCACAQNVHKTCRLEEG